jgi:hypothetical protein
MAISHISVKVGAAGKAGPHAAYVARDGKYADRLKKGERLEATEAGNLPAWAQANPQEFWQAADRHERANGTTYREFEIALPRELAAADRLSLVREFVAQELGDRHAYQFAIHCPTAVDGKEQPHAHVMFSERQRDGIERDPAHYFKRYNAKAPEKGGAKKGWGEHAGQTRSKDERAADLKALRQRWEQTCNAALECAGQTARVDLRSNAERGINLPPERKMKPSEWRTRRAEVIEFRQARAELSKAVPDVAAEVINLEQRRRDAERLKGADRPGPAVQSSRLFATRELGRIEREPDRSILDLSGNLAKAIEERDTTPPPGLDRGGQAITGRFDIKAQNAARERERREQEAERDRERRDPAYLREKAERILLAWDAAVQREAADVIKHIRADALAKARQHVEQWQAHIDNKPLLFFGERARNWQKTDDEMSWEDTKNRRNLDNINEKGWPMNNDRQLVIQQAAEQAAAKHPQLLKQAQAAQKLIQEENRQAREKQAQEQARMALEWEFKRLAANRAMKANGYTDDSQERGLAEWMRDPEKSKAIESMIEERKENTEDHGMSR